MKTLKKILGYLEHAKTALKYMKAFVAGVEAFKAELGIENDFENEKNN